MTAIGDSSAILASVTEQLSASARDMTRLADESSVQSGTGASAVQVPDDVQTVSVGSEQLGASIRQIAQNASEVSRVARRAVAVADGTAATLVEEQAATTTGMNRNVAEAALSAGQIAENIDVGDTATSAATRATDDAQAAIDEVARMATSMLSSVAKLRY